MPALSLPAICAARMWMNALQPHLLLDYRHLFAWDNQRPARWAASGPLGSKPKLFMLCWGPLSWAGMDTKKPSMGPVARAHGGRVAGAGMRPLALGGWRDQTGPRGLHGPDNLVGTWDQLGSC